MSKKREAEREAWKERKQALNDIQKQNDEAYALRIVNLNLHPLLLGITDRKQYRKISKQLQKAALTQDIWADGFALENKPVVLNDVVQQEQPVVQQQVVQQDVEPMEFSGPISIKIGDSKITVNSKEEADKLLEELAKNVPIYGKDKYEASLNDLKSILYTGKGNTKMHSGLMANLSGLSRLQAPISSVVSPSETVSNVIKSETDKTPTLWNAIIQEAYGGKYDPDFITSGLDTRGYLQRLEIYKNAVKLIDPTIITEGKTEEEINHQLFQKGILDSNAVNWLHMASDAASKGVKEEKPFEGDGDPYTIDIDPSKIHSNYKLIENYGDKFKDKGVIFVENPTTHQVLPLNLNALDPSGRYYSVADLANVEGLTFNTLQYDENFIKDDIMVIVDDNGNYHIGKIGDLGFTANEYKAIRDYQNKGANSFAAHQIPYVIGNKEKPNKYLEKIFEGKTGTLYYTDVTGILPDIGNYRAILTDYSSITPDGKFLNTPVILFNPEDMTLIKTSVTTLPNGQIEITNTSNGLSIYKGDVRTRAYKDTEESKWIINGELMPDVSTIIGDSSNRIYRVPDIETNPIPISELLSDGRYDRPFKTADATSNKPEDYINDNLKIKNIANDVLEYFKWPYMPENKESLKRYAYFALKVITLAGGANKLKELNFTDGEIELIMKYLEDWVYVPINKQGGIIKAKNGIDFSKLQTYEEAKKSQDDYYELKKKNTELQVLQKLQQQNIRDEKRIDFDSSTYDSKPWDASDYATTLLDGVATVTSFFGPAGIAWAGIAGLASTVIQAIDDIQDGDEDVWKNIGLNLGFTALSMIPGMKAGKLASKLPKARKYIQGADKIIESADKITDVKDVKGIYEKAKFALHEADNTLKNKGLIEDTFNKVKDGSLWLIDKGSGLLSIYGAYQGIKSTGNIIDDLQTGTSVSVDDVKGAIGGINAFRGLYGSFKNAAIDRVTDVIEIPGQTSKKIKTRIGTDINGHDIEIEVRPGMNKSSVEEAIKRQASNIRTEAEDKIKQLKAAKERGDSINEQELINAESLYNKLNDILNNKNIIGKSSVATSFNKDDLKFEKGLVRVIKSEDDLLNFGKGIFEKIGINRAKNAGLYTKEQHDKLTKDIDEVLDIIKELERTDAVNLAKPINKTDNIIDQLKALRNPVSTPTSTPVSSPVSSSLHSVNYNQYFKKGGQLYNSKEVDALVNLKKKEVTKYQTPVGPITIGNLKLTNLDFYKDYNAELILYYDELGKNGQLTPEKVEELNKLFSDKQVLNAWAKNQGYDGSRAIRDESGKVKSYLDQYHNLGLHTNSFKTGWNKNYSNSSFNEDLSDLTNSELWNQDGTFISDKNFGEKTDHRNANYMTDEELAQRNAIWANTGYKWELMKDSEVGEDGRKFYKIVPLSTEPGKETELTEDKPTDISLTFEKPEYSRPTGIGLAPIKAAIDLSLDHHANKRILEASYQDAPPKLSYVGADKKITDNFVSRWLAKKNAGELNTQSAFLANNIADIDKANLVQLLGWKQGLDATYDAAMKTYDEYKRTSEEQEELRRKYDLQNHEIKYKNDMQLYLNNLINKNRFVQFLNANKQSQQNVRNWLDSRLIEETKAYTDLYNRDLMAGAEMNKSNALTMAMNDYYTNIGLANDVDKEFADYLKAWKEDRSNASDLAAGKLPTMDSPIGQTGETYNEKKARLQREAQIKYQNAVQIAEADYQAASNYTMPYINQYYHWVPNFYRHYMYPGIDKKAKGGTLNFKEKKELLRLKNGYQQLRETVKDILKSIDNGEKQLDRISSGLSKERLLLLKNMLK